MSNKFAEKVKELGLAHLYGIKQKQGEDEKQLKVRCEYVRFRS
jgi:hypothetical protein